MSSIQAAINSVGGVPQLASSIGVPVQSVYFWRSGSRRVPAEYCPAIEAATGVRCEELRPDVQWGVLRGTVQAAATSSQPAAPGGQALGATEE